MFLITGVSTQRMFLTMNWNNQVPRLCHFLHFDSCVMFQLNHILWKTYRKVSENAIISSVTWSLLRFHSYIWLSMWWSKVITSVHEWRRGSRFPATKKKQTRVQFAIHVQRITSYGNHTYSSLTLWNSLNFTVLLLCALLTVLIFAIYLWATMCVSAQ